MKKIPKVLKRFIVLSPRHGSGKMHLKYTQVISTMQNCLLRSLIFYYGNNWCNSIETFNKDEGQYVMQFSCEPPRALDGSTASMFAPCFSWP